jgi:hypothetical protein
MENLCTIWSEVGSNIFAVAAAAVAAAAVATAIKEEPPPSPITGKKDIGVASVIRIRIWIWSDSALDSVRSGPFSSDLDVWDPIQILA